MPANMIRVDAKQLAKANPKAANRIKLVATYLHGSFRGNVHIYPRHDGSIVWKGKRYSLATPTKDQGRNAKKIKSKYWGKRPYAGDLYHGKNWGKGY